MRAGDIRAFLERHGLLARRDLGQNFLCDEGLAVRLVSLAGVEPGDSVLEIGTGLGCLTRALAERASCVVTLEVDAGLVRALRAEGCLPGNVELLHADVLRSDLGRPVAGCPARVMRPDMLASGWRAMRISCASVAAPMGSCSTCTMPAILAEKSA